MPKTVCPVVLPYVIGPSDSLVLVWQRPNFYSSPAILRSLNAGLEVSGLTKENIDVYDLYSLVLQPAHVNVH
jgi:hypothetical protein